MQNHIAVFPITAHSETIKVQGYLNAHFKKAIDDDKPLVVRIDQKQDDRTTAQNRLYWLQLGQVSKATGNSPDKLHFAFKRMFLARILARDDQGYAEMCKAVKELKKQQHPMYQTIAREVTKLTSTTVLNTKQFSEYLQMIEDYVLTKFNIVLTWPDDLMYLKGD